MSHADPRAAFRMTSEDAANLAVIHEAIREPMRPVETTSNCIRAALRAAGHLARAGQLRTTLAGYRKDLPT